MLALPNSRTPNIRKRAMPCGPDSYGPSEGISRSTIKEIVDERLQSSGVTGSAGGISSSSIEEIVDERLRSLNLVHERLRSLNLVHEAQTRTTLQRLIAEHFDSLYDNYSLTTRYLCAILSILDKPEVELGAVIVREAEVCAEGVKLGDIAEWWDNHKLVDARRVE